MRTSIITQESLSDVTWDDEYFKFCEFEGVSVEGETVSSDFVSCKFTDIDWYWGLFTLANFVNCKFINCTFRGTSFTDSRFFECEFTNCHFVQDNLNSECDFKGAVAYGCKVTNCEGFKAKSLCQA
jgi:uncharacterized protein YjbI with pentapeptide repeats